MLDNKIEHLKTGTCSAIQQYMRTLLLSLALLLSTAPLAHAGGYLSVGMGADSLLSGDLNSSFDSDAFTLGRVSVGARMGPVALEGVMFGADLHATSDEIFGQNPEGDEYSTTTLGLELKYIFGLAAGFEGYAKGGINKTWLTSRTADETSLKVEGHGYAIGGGVQYNFKLLPMIGAAVWLDYNHHLVELTDLNQLSLDDATIEGASNMIMLGLTLGG